MAEHLCRLLFAEHNPSITKPTSGSITHAVHHSVLSKTRYPCSISLRYPAKHTLAFMCCSYLGNALAQNIFAVLLISFSACYRTRLLHRHVMYKHKSSCPWLRIFFGMPYSLLPMACSFIFLSVTIMPKHEILLCPSTSLHSQVEGWGFALSRFPQNMSCTRFPRRFFFHHVLTHYYYAFRYHSTFTLRSLHSLYSSFISLLLISPYSLIPSGHIFLFASMLLFSPLRRGLYSSTSPCLRRCYSIGYLTGDLHLRSGISVL